MQKSRLRKYARLIARKGVQVQKGQDVFVTAGLEQPEFVAMVTQELYKAGARKIFVKFNYPQLEKYHVRHRSIKALSTVEPFEEAEAQYKADHLCARLALVTADPDALKGVNIPKMMKGQKARMAITRPYSEQSDGKCQWSVAAVPGRAWAKKVFPNVRAGKAVEMLWEAILSAARVDDDPVAAWEAHNADIVSRCRYLTGLNIDELEYHASNGTSLRIGLIEGAIFCGGGESTDKGVYYHPNIPTEECFTTPHRERVDGILYSTKPLVYQGQVIDNFFLRFEKGQIVEAHAGVNDEMLQQMIARDEGSAYLGECALVPFDSPINQTGLLFYNTLFDENACCHMAIGRGYTSAVPACKGRTKEEIRALGVNQSGIHVDFMIGTADLSVIAHCRDGKSVEIFRDGTWAF